MSIPLTAPFDTDRAATIASGESLSGVIDCLGYTLVGLQMPAAWTAAVLTFQASIDGATYADLYDEDGAEVTVQADASRAIVLDPASWAGFRYLRIRSGTSAAAVNQDAERSITLSLRPVA